MKPNWSYNDAFSRQLGLVSEQEQEILKEKRIAIAGMGGVGGYELMTLVRMGFEKFTLSDDDEFEVANFNRQRGASIKTVGQCKLQTMVDIASDVNPNVDIRLIKQYVNADNIDEFLDGANLYVDAVDAFNLTDRRRLFNNARERGIYSITAGPLGFTTAFMIFDPQGLSFDEYFGIFDGQNENESTIRFLTGLAPAGLHTRHLDFSYLDIDNQRGPSVSSACMLASGVVGAYAVKILLGRGNISCCPYYHQFDVYGEQYVRKRLLFASRNPILMLNRYKLKKLMIKQGISFE